MSADDSLLEAVWAAPDDDGPRTVLADTWMERGDPRGELVALQLAIARGQGSDAALDREAVLLEDAHLQQLVAGPLLSVGRCVFERGFPVEVTLLTRPEPGLATLPLWRTVRRLRGCLGWSPEDFAPLFGGASGAALQVVEGLSTEVLPQFVARTLPWRSCRLADTGVRPRLVTRGELQPFANVHDFGFNGFGLEPDALEALPRLERFSSYGMRPPAPALLANATRLKELVLHLTWGAEIDARLLRAAPTLQWLSLNETGTPLALFGLPVRRLSILPFGTTVPRAALDSMPHLERLDWNLPRPFAKHLPPVLTQLAGSALAWLGCDDALRVERPGTTPVLHARFPSVPLDDLLALGQALRTVDASLVVTPVRKAGASGTALDEAALRDAWQGRVTVTPTEVTRSLFAR